MSSGYSSQHDQIAREALDWFSRPADARSAQEDAAFYAWLASDPRHGDAYAALGVTWEIIGGSERLAALADLDRSRPRWTERLTRPRILMLGAAAALSAAAIVFFGAPLLSARPQAAYETQIAELRPVALEDGSVVTIGAHSDVRVIFTDTERRVELRRGEAFFEVTPDASRPFYVEAGDTVVRVVGTKFDVRRGPAHVGVAVLEGVVRVSREGEAPLRELRAGQRVELQRTRFLAAAEPAEILAVSAAAPAGAWRHGRLAYSDAPLADVIADINRYYAPGVEVSSEAGELRMTAGFSVEEIPDFLSALDQALPVHTERRQDGRYHIAAHP